MFVSVLCILCEDIFPSPSDREHPPAEGVAVGDDPFLSWEPRAGPRVSSGYCTPKASHMFVHSHRHARPQPASPSSALRPLNPVSVQKEPGIKQSLVYECERGGRGTF